MDYTDVIEKALQACEHAYAPYSRFCVGACLKMKDGSYICGANVENASYGLTSCAERNALFAAYSQGYRKQDIQCMAITAKQDELCPPCGACRQVMAELLEPVSYTHLDVYKRQKYPVLQQDNSDITITTAGSTSVEKTLKAALEAFSPLAGNVKFVMNQNGSGDAVPRTLGKEKDGANKADIGFASRAFKEDGSEDIASAMVSGQYCIDAVVAVVHKDNPLEDITQAQLKDIFTGKITNWEDLNK